MLTNVTTRTSRNIYVYSPGRLWTAYGLAIFATIFAAAFGIFAMLTNGASYSDNFSTILCSSSSVELSEDVQPKDTRGQDPLPEYLAKATVAFGASMTMPTNKEEGAA